MVTQICLGVPFGAICNLGHIQQARAENTMYRYKTIIGGKLRSRHFDSQKNEAVLSCSILNKMASFGMPDSYKIA